jgi:hypothetical protein
MLAMFTANSEGTPSRERPISRSTVGKARCKRMRIVVTARIVLAEGCSIWGARL